MITLVDTNILVNNVDAILKFVNTSDINISFTNKLCIINLPYKNTNYNNIDYNIIINGLNHLLMCYKTLNIKTIIIPIKAHLDESFDEYYLTKIIDKRFSCLKDINVIVYVNNVKYIKEKWLIDFSDDLPFGDPFI